MLTKRIIPCLDVDHGRVVKGKKFQNIQDVADPVELGRYYSEQGADELVFYDITATYEDRDIFINIVEKVAEAIRIPFTIGGGISKVEDFRKVLMAGADKVSVNSSAVKNPPADPRSRVEIRFPVCGAFHRCQTGSSGFMGRLCQGRP